MVLLSGIRHRSVRFVDKLNVPNHAIREMPREQFHQMQLERWGSRDFTAAEALEFGEDLVQPFFDYDEIRDRQPLSQEIEAARQKCQDAIESIFEDEPSFQYNKQVLEAWRHGWIGDKFKISWRFTVTGFSIKRQDMPKLIDFFAGKSQKFPEKGLFDPSVYNRGLRVSLIVFF